MYQDFVLSLLLLMSLIKQIQIKTDDSFNQLCYKRSSIVSKKTQLEVSELFFQRKKKERGRVY